MSWRSPTPDGDAPAEAVYGRSSPAWLRELPAIGVPRRVLVQNYTRTITKDGREVIRRREKGPEGDGLPPGRTRIASPYDTDARRGAKREEFWLGCKLHITETCHDAPPCSRRQAGAAAAPGPARGLCTAGKRGQLSLLPRDLALAQARYRGLPKTRLDHIYLAAALNPLRLQASWTGTPLDRQRTSHLARLEPGLAA